tara:strand:- start:2060 stop:3016 length:957 start_codon:yes stop_codon:yes gene_type:complete
MSVEVVTMGEALLRFSVPRGTRLTELSDVSVSVGGAESNVAVALARMGCSAAWISAVPDNALGHRVRNCLGSNGVDVQHVQVVPEERMGLYFVEPGSFPRPTQVVYDRRDSAVTRLDPSDIPWSMVESAKAVHLSGITPALSDSLRQLSLEFVARARAAGTAVCVDVNYRSLLWEVAEARPALLELCYGADLVILTKEDAGDVFGFSGDPEELVRQARDAFSSRRVAVTLGPDGAVLIEGDEVLREPGYEAEVVDRIGSGDAFAAGLVLGMVRGDVPGHLRTAVAMAVLKLGIQGDHLVAGPEEVASMLRGSPREVGR